MKPRAVIIGGPQGSGKTFAVDLLTRTFPDIISKHLEVNPYVVFGKKHLGAAFVDCDQEKIIVEYDLKRLKSANFRNKNKIHLIETGPFHLVYLRTICKQKIFKKYLTKYNRIYQNHDSTIIFIDTSSQVSFKRRKAYYQGKIKKEVKRQGLRGLKAQSFSKEMMRKYKQRIESLYLEWKYCLSVLPQRKVVVENNNIDISVFSKKLIHSFKKLTKIDR